jgi:2-polyprenyl-3-methyl-5-hydroxy-6-metoxy-1,4-benzoquinol methylase
MKEKAVKLIEEIKLKINDLETLIEKLDIKETVQHTDQETKNLTNEKEEISEIEELLKNPNWVEAVPLDLICDENNEEDKMDRARGIRDVFHANYDYSNKKILDIGTGYGHLVKSIAEKNPTIVVGYDIKNEFQIQNDEKIKTTILWDEVVQYGPYDLIYLYDVIDHAENETPQDILRKAKSVLSNDGIIKMRCHPFISRHGGHVYTKINKSYAHLVFSKEELIKLGHNMKNFPTTQVTSPLKTYSKFIFDAELKIVTHNVTNQPAEQLFLSGVFAERIKKNLKQTNLMIPQMGMQFVDFTLSK